MKFVIQRVKEASVTVDGQIVGKIGAGLMILVGLTHDDTLEYVDHVTDKFLNGRGWDDSKGARWKESVKSLGYEILLVSQFTLYSNMKGNKPDFHLAMDNEPAKKMFEVIVERTRAKYVKEKIQTGTFGAYMNVQGINDGPVTIEWEYPGDKLEKIAQNNMKKDKEGKKEDKKDSKKDNKKSKNEKREQKKEDVKETTEVKKEEVNKIVSSEDKKEDNK